MKYRVLFISGFICWGAPLLAATIGLFAYWQTHAQFLVDIGFVLLVVGFILGLIGIISATYRLNLGELDPGEKIDTYYNPKAESGVKIQIVSKNQVKEATVTGYASMFGSDDSRITVSKNSEIIIRKLKP